MPLALLQIELPASNLPYLYAALTVSWAGFFAYVFFVSRRQQELQKDISELRRSLEQEEAPKARDITAVGGG